MDENKTEESLQICEIGIGCAGGFAFDGIYISEEFLEDFRGIVVFGVIHEFAPSQLR